MSSNPLLIIANAEVCIIYGGSMTDIRHRRTHRKTKHKAVIITVVFIIIGVISFASIEVFKSIKTKEYADEVLAQVRPIMHDKPYIESISLDDFNEAYNSISFRLNESFNELSTEERHIFLRDELYKPIAKFYYRWSFKLPIGNPLFNYSPLGSLYLPVITYSGDQVYKYGQFKFGVFNEVFIDGDGEKYEYVNEQERVKEYARIREEWSSSSNKSNEVNQDIIKIQIHSSNALQCSNCGRYYEPGDIAGNYWKIAVSSLCLDCYEIYKLQEYLEEKYN